ncbi:MAG: hypothetical protein ACWIPH_08765 [Ostreibacterium sp.]
MLNQLRFRKNIVQRNLLITCCFLTLSACSIDIDSSNNQFTHFYGGGSEPGWQINLTQTNYKTYQFTFDTNYGDDKYKGTVKLTDTQPNQFIGKTLNGKPISIITEKVNCSDDSDKVYGNRITLKFNHKILRGCGTSSRTK